MDAGDIIYFILVLFILIFSFFKKPKKENSGGTVVSPSSQDHPPMNDRTPDILRRRSVQKAKNEESEKPKSNQRPVFQSSLDLVNNRTINEGDRAIENSLYAIGDAESQDEITRRSEQAHPLVRELVDGDTDEWTKAFIYSEIFTRKY
jgi:flagellar basal body-associated protein FliL